MAARIDRVDLTYQEDALTGVVAGVQVALPLDVPRSTGSARGTYGDSPVTGSWQIASNYEVAEQPASLQGTFVNTEISLSTTFMLRDKWNPELVGARIVGNVGGDAVDVNIAPGNNSPNTYTANGHVGATTIALRAAVGHDRATVEGTVENNAVKLTATGTQYMPPGIRIRGRWDGPSILCLLTTCCLLYFM